MTAPEAGLRVDSDTYVLRLHDPDPDTWRLDGLAQILSDVDFLYRFSCEVNFDTLAVRRTDFEFVRSPYVQAIDEQNAPRLAVLELRTGSLWMDVAEYFSAFNVNDLVVSSVAGSVAAYSLKCLVKIFEDGPERLVSWSTVVLDAKLRRIERMNALSAAEQQNLHLIRTRREAFEQEALMLEARHRLSRLRESMPELETSIFNQDDGSEIQPPRRVFDNNVPPANDQRSPTQ